MVESGRTSSASLSSDTKTTPRSWLLQFLLFQSFPFTSANLHILISNSGLIRLLYNSSLKRGGGQHPHRTKIEVFNLKKYDCIKNGGRMVRLGRGESRLPRLFVYNQ